MGERKFFHIFDSAELERIRDSSEGVAVLLLRPHSLKVLNWLAQIVEWRTFIEETSPNHDDTLQEIYSDMTNVYVNLDKHLTDIAQILNDRLQGIENAIAEGGGEGGTLYDLIQLLMLVFGVSPAGLASLGNLQAPTQLSEVGFLSQMKDVMTGQAVIEGSENVLIQGIIDKLQGLIDKECSPIAIPIVQASQDVTGSGLQLIENGNWLEGRAVSGTVNGFLPDYWQHIGEIANDEYPYINDVDGDKYISINHEANTVLIQVVTIPAGYGSVVLSNNIPAGVEFGGLRIRVVNPANNFPWPKTVITNEPRTIEWAIDVKGGDRVKIMIDCPNSPDGNCGELQMLAYATSLPTSNTTTVGGIGGSMGKGRKRGIQPVKQQWTVTSVNNPSNLANWVIEKIEAVHDFAAMRFKAVKSVLQSFALTRIIRADASVRIANLSFNASMPESGNNSFTLEFFNGSSWVQTGQALVSGAYLWRIDFPEELTGDRLIRLNINADLDGVASGGYDLWDLEIEEIDD